MIKHLMVAAALCGVWSLSMSANEFVASQKKKRVSRSALQDQVIEHLEECMNVFTELIEEYAQSQRTVIAKFHQMVENGKTDKKTLESIDRVLTQVLREGAEHKEHLHNYISGLS